ncbi:MAG: response regulator [Oligoflexia bacterium]|nr:response regulator [Oligoflexia bacterium]
MKILIVDDAKIATEELSQLLKADGHITFEAENGIQALQLLKKNTDIDLIITDYYMPEMDGITMCERLHEVPELSIIPVIMATTEVSDDIKEVAKKLGIIAWITKPYDPELIVETIKQLEL